MSAFIAAFCQRNRMLALWGWLHVASLAIVLGLALFDPRWVVGLTPWLKTIKFTISIAVLLWMLARLADYLREPCWAVRAISASTTLLLVGVAACVSLQSVRGTISSFNIGAYVDTLIYLARSATIAAAMMLVPQLLILLWVQKVRLPRWYLWRIRLGLVVFFLGGRQGGIIFYVAVPLAVLVLVLVRRLLIARRNGLKTNLRPSAPIKLRPDVSFPRQSHRRRELRCTHAPIPLCGVNSLIR